jgi:hypothetical protein
MQVDLFSEDELLDEFVFGFHIVHYGIVGALNHTQPALDAMIDVLWDGIAFFVDLENFLGAELRAHTAPLAPFLIYPYERFFLFFHEAFIIFGLRGLSFLIIGPFWTDKVL